MKTIIILLLIWYFVSQFVAEAIIALAGEAPNEEQSQAIHAGLLMLPAFAGWILVAWLTWHLWRFANYMRVPWIDPPSDNLMDYL